MKKLVIAGVVAIVIIAGIAVLTLSNLGPIVKKAVNTVGPQITKTEVKVDDVNISIFSGQAKIEKFFLGNPKGFDTAQAMLVGSIYADIDEDSITKDTIIINKIEIIAPEITFEKKAGVDNFQTILNNVKKSAKISEKSKEKSDTNKAQNSKKVIIKNVIVKDGKVNLSMTALAGKSITAPLPDIHLKDIGKKKNGATAAEAFEQIFESLYSSISADSVTNMLNDGLKELGSLKDLGNLELLKGEETAKKVLDSTSKGVESVTKGLKNLFKKE